MRARLERQHAARAANQATGEHGVVPDVGSDVDEGVPGPQEGAQQAADGVFIDTEIDYRSAHHIARNHLEQQLFRLDGRNERSGRPAGVKALIDQRHRTPAQYSRQITPELRLRVRTIFGEKTIQKAHRSKINEVRGVS